MKNILLTAILASTAASVAYSRLTPRFTYSMGVREVTQRQRYIPSPAVYVGPAVKLPGGYEFSKGLTVASLVEMAGGLQLGENVKFRERWYIFIYHPTAKDSEKDSPMCTLDLKEKPGFAVSKCSIVLRPGDLVYVTAPEDPSKPL